MTFDLKKSVIFFIIGFIFASVLMIIALWVYFYFGFFQKIDLQNKIINIEVKTGDSLSSLINKLKEEGLIKSEILFKLALKNINFEKRLQVGSYTFSGQLNGWDILKILQNQPDISVVFPEGKTVEEISAILEQNKIVSKDNFLAALKNFDSSKILGFKLDNFEGYLFPDTYQFKSGQNTGEIIEKILKNFKNKVLINLQDKLKVSKFNLQDIIIIASILEKEVRSFEEKKIAAGILLRRLEDNNLLQVDSTLNYILKTGRNFLTGREIEIDSPYNTYKYKGLPPTPISNPGLESILAVLEPIKTDYYFYLTDKQGKAYFAKTYDEHLSNKRKYLK